MSPAIDLGAGTGKCTSCGQSDIPRGWTVCQKCDIAISNAQTIEAGSKDREWRENAPKREAEREQRRLEWLQEAEKADRKRKGEWAERDREEKEKKAKLQADFTKTYNDRRDNPPAVFDVRCPLCDVTDPYTHIEPTNPAAAAAAAAAQHGRLSDIAKDRKRKPNNPTYKNTPTKKIPKKPPRKTGEPRRSIIRPGDPGQYNGPEPEEPVSQPVGSWENSVTVGSPENPVRAVPLHGVAAEWLVKAAALTPLQIRQKEERAYAVQYAADLVSGKIVNPLEATDPSGRFKICEGAKYCLACRAMMPSGIRYKTIRQEHYPNCETPQVDAVEKILEGLPSREKFDRIVADFQSPPPPPKKPTYIRPPEVGDPEFIGPRTLGTGFQWPTQSPFAEQEEMIQPGTYGLVIEENLDDTIAAILTTYKDDGVLRIPYQAQCLDCHDPMYRGTLAFAMSVDIKTEMMRARHFNWKDARGFHHGCSFKASPETPAPGRVIRSKKLPGADGEDIMEEPTRSYPMRGRGVGQQSGSTQHAWGKYGEAGPPPEWAARTGDSKRVFTIPKSSREVSAVVN